jgi:acetyl esterase/lipase
MSNPWNLVFGCALLLLSFIGLFLSIWIVVPAPTAFLLPLGVGAPEISPWLFGLNAIVILLMLFSERKGWIYLLAIACSVVALALSAYPLSQVAAANQQVTREMYRVLGIDYHSKIAAELKPKLRPQPLVLTDVFRGIPSGDVKIQSGIVFAKPDGVSLSLAVYQPIGSNKPSITDPFVAQPPNPLPEKYPTIVTLYGGGWQHGEPTQDEFFSRYMASRGYTVVAIDYRHAPQYRFPNQLEDVKAALLYIRTHAQELKVDVDRLVLMGRSAGAQLAMLATYPPSSTSVRAVVDYYGPVDLTVGYEQPPQPDPIDTRALLRAFLGGTPAEKPDVYRLASPSTYIKGNLPPTLLVYGKRDHVVKAEFGRTLRDRLAKAGNQVVYIELPWSEHAFDAVFNGIGNQLALYYTEQFVAWAVSDRR